ncbi:MAG: Hsp20/alpha crystallin family protein [bacterium]
MQPSLKEMKFLFASHTTGEPPVDLYETDDALVCEIDLPGINPEDVEIQVFDDLLIIEGIRSDHEKTRQYRYVCMERSMDSFRRIVRIPTAVNPLEGTASYRLGVVKVVLPKVKERTVRIKIEKQEGA